jgi:hypothetical protein
MFAIIKMILARLVAALSWIPKRSDAEDPPADDNDPFERQLERSRKSFEEQIRKAIAHIKPLKESDDNDPFGRGRERSRAEEASYLRARLAMEDERLEAAKKAKKKEAEEAEQRAKEAERSRDDRVVPEQRRGPERDHAQHSTLARWYDEQKKRTHWDQPLKQEPKQEQSRHMDQIRKATAKIKPDRSKDRDRDRGNRGYDGATTACIGSSRPGAMNTPGFRSVPMCR